MKNLNSPMNFRSNNEVAIHVPDLQKAEEFYGNVFGFQVVARRNNQIEFETGALRLYVNRDAASLLSYIPSFDVSDFEAAKAYLQQAGCPTLTVNTDSSVTYFKDPFGFVFDIIERH